ncbi:CRIB domain-containing protein RIC6 [Sesamum alatum]|uniref:CRIB domain-containing protein RIC6 n=1 Tax=Sesamum alatum TaxID=300844 RepID=A0AAE2D0Q6_9LAMI|nr:CRIB domain-containing protein RIC6 [Sesamum alatum]
MSTKMKGLLKGLRYISQIFDEEKEQDIQIGLPTDVKHVAHIGWDGPKVDSPSWMKEFKSSNGGFQSAPLAPPVESRKDESEIQWVSEDSKRGQKQTNSAPGKDHPELPKSSRRSGSHSSNDQNNSNHDSSPKKKDSSTKSRPRRSKEQLSASDGGPKAHESGSASPGPDAPKKTRRKKSKEAVNKEHGSTRSRSKATTSTSNGTHNPDPAPGSESSDPVLQPSSSHLSPAQNTVDDEESESRGKSKE